MFTITPRILKNLWDGPATRRYPEKAREPFEATRGVLENQMDRCRLCGVCAAKCPTGCIRVDKEKAIWSVDPFVCVYCGVCVENCPEKSLSQSRNRGAPMTEKRAVTLERRPTPESR